MGAPGPGVAGALESCPRRCHPLTYSVLELLSPCFLEICGFRVFALVDFLVSRCSQCPEAQGKKKKERNTVSLTESDFRKSTD